MSKKNSHTNKVYKIGEGYKNEYLTGVVLSVSAPITAKGNGKEYYIVEISVTQLIDKDKCAELDLTIGSIIFRQSTPERRLNGTFNKLQNANGTR